MQPAIGVRLPERVFQTCHALRGRGRVRVSSPLPRPPPSPPAESLSISRSYGDASASFATAPAKGGLRIRRLGLRLLARRASRMDAESDRREAARLGVSTADLPPLHRDEQA